MTNPATSAGSTIIGGAADAALPDRVTMKLHALWHKDSACSRMPREQRAFLIAKTLNDFQTQDFPNEHPQSY
jgi:hypothetical protein